jgi:hypothetical protein
VKPSCRKGGANRKAPSLLVERNACRLQVLAADEAHLAALCVRAQHPVLRKYYVPLATCDGLHVGRNISAWRIDHNLHDGPAAVGIRPNLLARPERLEFRIIETEIVDEIVADPPGPVPVSAPNPSPYLQSYLWKQRPPRLRTRCRPETDPRRAMTSGSWVGRVDFVEELLWFVRENLQRFNLRKTRDFVSSPDQRRPRTLSRKCRLSRTAHMSIDPFRTRPVHAVPRIHEDAGPEHMNGKCIWASTA